MSFPSVDDRAVRTSERARRITDALADAARRARQSRAVAHSSYRDRRPWWIRHLSWLLFLGFAAAPSAAGVGYYGLWASDQYVAEARFTVRNGEIPKVDALGALIGFQAMTVVQDTQVVANYVQSRGMVDRLSQTLDLRRIYGNPDIDVISRFWTSRPVERLVDYWRGMTDVSIHASSGIVTVSVRAFSASDAVAVAQAVLAESERLVNDMNERMRRDSVASAQADLVRARDRLSAARQAYEQMRNREGLLDAGRAGEGYNTILQSLRTDRINLQQEIDTQLNYVGPAAPQIQALRTRMAALDVQIRELEGRLTSQDKSLSGEQKPLSAIMTGFGERAIELSIAEKQYATAFSSLELARTLSDGKHVYLNTFIRPSLPEDAGYPRRVLFSCLVVLVSIAAWGCAAGTVALVRSHWV